METIGDQVGVGATRATVLTLNVRCVLWYLIT